MHSKVVKYGNINVCLKCGLAVNDNGAYMGFEKGLANYLDKRRKKKR